MWRIATKDTMPIHRDRKGDTTMAKATTKDGVIVTDITDEVNAGKANGKKDTKQPSNRQQYLTAQAERARKRELKEVEALQKRIALASDPKLLCKARMAGYSARLADRPVTDDPYAGRLANFSGQWALGWTRCGEDPPRCDTA